MERRRGHFAFICWGALHLGQDTGFSHGEGPYFAIIDDLILK